MDRAVTFVLFLAALPCIDANAGDAIREQEIRAHIDFLADDLLEGRDSGHRGSDIAALYIETRLRDYGVQPLLDDWQMPVEIRGAKGAGESLITVDDVTRSGRAIVQPIPESPDADARGPSTIDREGDVDGRVVILAGGDDVDKAAAAAREVFDRGAAAVIFVTASDEFRVRDRPDRRRRGAPRGGQGGGMLADSAAAEAGVAAMRLLAGPAVRVNRYLGAELIEAADSGRTIHVEVHREGRDETTNVLGWIEGSDPALKDELVIVGAHYDHVGHDDLGNIWNGADDNASGTAAVLEIAEAIASSASKPRRSVVFALWGAEERGLYGSRAFVRQKVVDVDKIAAYINLDMISRNDPDHVSAVAASDELFRLSEEAAKRQGMEVDAGVSFFLDASDTEPFVKEKIPTLFYFTGLHSDYHRPSDDPPTADAAKCTRIAQATLDVMLSVADADTRPTFKAPQRLGPPRGPSRRLGVYPAATTNGDDGIRIESVSPKSLAESAGIQPGDRIIRIAGLPVKRVADLRAALRAPKAGEEFPIDLVRGGDAAETLTVYGRFEE